MKVYTFKCEPELIDRVDELAKQKNTTRSDIIRKAIEAYLSNKYVACKDDDVRDELGKAITRSLMLASIINVDNQEAFKLKLKLLRTLEHARSIAWLLRYRYRKVRL